MAEPENGGVWQRAEIESPCVKICVIHPEARICVGCHRTGEEIARWSTMTPDQRQAIMQDLAARGAGLTKRRGGRANRARRTQT